MTLENPIGQTPPVVQRPAMLPRTGCPALRQLDIGPHVVRSSHRSVFSGYTSLMSVIPSTRRRALSLVQDRGHVRETALFHRQSDRYGWQRFRRTPAKSIVSPHRNPSSHGNREPVQGDRGGGGTGSPDAAGGVGGVPVTTFTATEPGRPRRIMGRPASPIRRPPNRRAIIPVLLAGNMEYTAIPRSAVMERKVQ